MNHRVCRCINPQSGRWDSGPCPLHGDRSSLLGVIALYVFALLAILLFLSVASWLDARDTDTAAHERAHHSTARR